MHSILDDDRTALTYPCTCQAPLCVELHTNNEGVCGAAQADLMHENLKHYGWSPVSVNGAPSPCPSHDDILKLFPTDGSKNNGGSIIEIRDVTYHGAESGSSEGSVESKESYEVQLSKCCSIARPSLLSPRGAEDDAENLIKTWCQTLSWIAHQVCMILRVPPNTLLSDDSRNSDASLDILRVFHYYAATKPEELGSSPHTDWGSLTIVWQDDVGGLQTFCRACRKWVDVNASSRPSSAPLNTGNQQAGGNPESHRWECIVHVGDMASLVLNHENEFDTLSSDSLPKTNPTRMFWPSPEHRVVNSATRERTSLVYFGYPPANCTLQSVQNALRDWQPSMRGHRLPLKDYYLLRDQSTTSAAGMSSVGSTQSRTSSEGTTTSPSTLEMQSYSSIRDQQVREIISWKWNQVQRD